MLEVLEMQCIVCNVKSMMVEVLEVWFVCVNCVQCMMLEVLEAQRMCILYDARSSRSLVYVNSVFVQCMMLEVLEAYSVCLQCTMLEGLELEVQCMCVVREGTPRRHELRRHEPPRFAWQTEPPLCRPTLHHTEQHFLNLGFNV